ncbi:MAG: AraC family transcriptional regulator ligand-binding domain-containing protein [Planctomycetota bacterium]
MSDESDCTTSCGPSWRVQAPRPRVLSSVASSTLNYAQAHGVTLADVNRVVRINRFEMLDPLARVDERVIPAVWNLLDRAVPGAALSMHMAGAVGLDSLGPVSTVTRFSKTIGQALEVLVRFSSILSESLELELVDDGTTVSLLGSNVVDSLDGGYGSEVGLAMTFRLLRDALGGELGIQRVELAHAPFGPLKAYEDFFRVPVIPSAGRHAIVVDANVLDRPTAEADHILADFARANLELLEDRFGLAAGRFDNSSLFRAVADLGPLVGYRVEELADRMSMSARSLQRAAEAEGISLRQLLSDAREAQARRLLSDPDRSIAEIARSVGYTDERSFRRAFRRWTGQAPSEYRELE